MIVSPSENHFKRSTFEEFRRWLPWEHMIEQNKNEGWWLFDTGARVWYCGLGNPDAVRGTPVNWCWGDELALMNDDTAWKNIIGRTREGIDPCVFVTTTPKPNWLEDVCVTNPPTLDNGTPLLQMFVVPTYANQANLDPAYYQSLKAAYTGDFAAQELEGQFVQFEGIVYNNFSKDQWPEGNICNDEPDLDVPFELSFDDGYKDPRAIYWLQVLDDSVFVFDEMYHTHHTEDVCVNEVVERTKENEWPLPELAVGSHEAITLREYFRKADIPARFEMHRVVDRVKNMRRLICNANGKRILKIHPRCENLILEITKKYQYPSGQRKSANAEQPQDKDNHAVDSLGAHLWHRIRNSFME